MRKSPRVIWCFGDQFEQSRGGGLDYTTRRAISRKDCLPAVIKTAPATRCRCGRGARIPHMQGAVPCAHAAAEIRAAPSSLRPPPRVAHNRNHAGRPVALRWTFPMGGCSPLGVALLENTSAGWRAGFRRFIVRRRGRPCLHGRLYRRGPRRHRSHPLSASHRRAWEQ
jgi:hypothetical protein